MGNCSGTAGSTVAAEPTTAKLIHHDGRLQEFSYPVTVSYVLSQVVPDSEDSFICNSDEMDFDDVVSAVRGDDELQLGQIYFSLPSRLLGRPIPPEEMAALAVKASAALVKAGVGGGVKNMVVGGGGKKDVEYWGTSTEGVVGGGRKPARKSSSGSGGGNRRSNNGGGGGAGRSNKKVLKRNLSTINEN